MITREEHDYQGGSMIVNSFVLKHLIFLEHIVNLFDLHRPLNLSFNGKRIFNSVLPLLLENPKTELKIILVSFSFILKSFTHEKL